MITNNCDCCCYRFSPSGDRLAVGSDDSCVDIYSVSDLSKGITRASYCRGIPSGVTHMDWSTSGEYLQVGQCPVSVVWENTSYQGVKVLLVGYKLVVNNDKAFD